MSVKEKKKMASRGLIPIRNLPREISPQDAILTAYGEDIDWIEQKLKQGISVLVECDKQLVLYLFLVFRQRASTQSDGLKFQIVGGPPTNESGGSIIQNVLMQLAQAIFGGDPDRTLVVPHLDVAVTTTQSGLSDRAREVIAMIYENPQITMLSFKDTAFELPKPVEDLFPAKRQILGIARDRLGQLICQREARKFGVDEFNPFSLYKYVSGLNAIRFRQILEHFEDRIDYNPDDPGQTDRLFRDIREMTLLDKLEVPQIDLDTDVGGYEPVKTKMKEEILELLAYKDGLTDEDEIREIEEIVPKGMLFVGPPGTGKTFFAKAMATTLDASVSIVSGPELKSKWVGESEKNLRDVFVKARKAAPAIIIFDEIDSFATTRGTYTGSGVEHSMVNQLLTEMDGFRKEELVFVIGTTNFPQSLDPALLRPGRFEMQITIPYPNDKDRKAILEIYRKKFSLDLSDELLKFIVQKTSGFVDRFTGTRFSGDHLYAICRSLKRIVIRRSWKGNGGTTITEADCVKAIRGKGKSKINLEEKEERTVAIHEAGHAICGHYCVECDPIERISISGEDDILGAVMHEVKENQYIMTEAKLLDTLCSFLGGRAAEQHFLGNPCTGSSNDLQNATEIVRRMVEDWGMSKAGLRVYSGRTGTIIRSGSRDGVGNELSSRLDEEIEEILSIQYKRSLALLKEHENEHRALVAALLDRKVLYAKDVIEILGERPQ